MKNIIFLLLISTSSFCQSLQDLVLLYEKECSQIVNDTIEQVGTINYALVPVVGQDGNILHYALGSPDTTWQEPSCPVFKFPKKSNFYSIGSGWNNSITLTTTTDSYPIYSTEKQDKTRVKITRKYVCQVKLREIEPFGENFWEWVKNRER